MCSCDPSPTSILAVLTEDLLLRINEKVALRPDRKAWRLVCKDFLWVDALSRKTLRVLRVEFLHALLRRFPNVETLDVSVCPRFDDNTVSSLLRPYLGDREWNDGRPGTEEVSGWTRKVKVLNLSRATGLRWSGLEMLVKACVNLSQVDVSYCCDFGDREARALSYGTSLREVIMDKCLKLTDVGLAKVAIGIENVLERISLKWCMEISDLGIDLLCRKCRNLKHIDISYLKVTNESLRAIASLDKLEVLVMVGCTSVDDNGLSFLENGCPFLREIDISRCDCISSSGLMHLIRGHHYLVKINAGYSLSEISSTLVHCMSGLKHLDTFNIDGACLSDTILQAIGSNCKSLTEVGLSKCVGMTNTGIIHLMSSCSNLKILNLTCCHFLTDDAICGIANYLVNLVCLKLESCNKITETSLLMIGSHSLKLAELDLTDCWGVNDRALEYLSGCSRLQCLKLGLCESVTSNGLYHIASNCSKLQELDLYRCIGIGDDSLKAISKGCKMLRKLNLSYCNEISDIGMEFLGYLKELCDLELRGLARITSAGLTKLVCRCHMLTELDLKHCEKIDDSGFLALAHYSQNLRQINLSFCSISDRGLYMVMGNLSRLEDVKLVWMDNVTFEGLELALRAGCGRIKKVKLVESLRFLLSPEILEMLRSRGCKIRWD